MNIQKIMRTLSETAVYITYEMNIFYVTNLFSSIHITYLWDKRELEAKKSKYFLFLLPWIFTKQSNKLQILAFASMCIFGLILIAENVACLVGKKIQFRKEV